MSFCLLYAHPDSSAATRTRPDSYSPRAFVSSHSRKLANAQTERSVAATSTALVTESVLSSTYQHCYWMFLSRSPIATTDSRTRIDSYLSRAFVSSHSRKLANAQTERSVVATSAVLVTESELSSTYQHCYWMRWESLYRKNDFTTLYRVRRWYLIIQLLSYYLYVACTFMQGYLMTDMAILMLHKNVSRETLNSDGSIPLTNQLPSSCRELP